MCSVGWFIMQIQILDFNLLKKNEILVNMHFGTKPSI